MRALIIDQCGNRAALPAARALKRDGWIVAIGSPHGSGLARRSRAVDATYDMPEEDASAGELVATVNSAVAHGGYEVVFSLDDVGVMALSRRRDELDAVFPYGSHAGVEQATDKRELTRQARLAGLSTPRTLAELEAASVEPDKIVVKPRLTFSQSARGHVRAHIASSVTEAHDIAARMREAGSEPVLQEHCEGHLMALVALVDRTGDVVACAQQRADRRWPIDAGISARAHTTTVDASLLAGAKQLLQQLEWFGLAQLQFIGDPTGTPRLIDFNGRFYGSLPLSVAAGLNLPSTWGRLALGLPVGSTPDAKVGARYQWLAGDLNAGRKQATSSLGAIAAVAESLMFAPRAAHCLWSVRDPRPAIAQIRKRTIEWMQRR
jgi:predicted ATP-grasp superfamily ATP-dependent carboligase